MFLFGKGRKEGSGSLQLIVTNRWTIHPGTSSIVGKSENRRDLEGLN